MHCNRKVTKGCELLWEACSAGAAGAVRMTLDQLHESGQAPLVTLPLLDRSMALDVLSTACKSCSNEEIALHNIFTAQFGECG